MKTVGASEAKTHFSALLEAIERGEEITITRHGRPVAKLVPIGDRQAMSPVEAVEDLRELRSRLTLKDAWKALRDTGRQ